MPSSSLSMASVTILILDRYRSSTGLPALVPGVFLSSFLPLPCVRLSLLSFPTPDFLDCPHLWFSSLLSCTSAAWSSGTVCVFPRRVRFRFPQLPPSLLSLPCVWLFPRRFYCRLLVHRRFNCSPFTFRIPVLPLRLCGFGCCGPRVCRSAPHHSPERQVNRASDGK